LHLKNIFAEGEMDESSVTEDFSVTATDGKNYRTKHYNLDAIIAVGYRINTKRATAFRQWATTVLRNYVLRGYVIDKEHMKLTTWENSPQGKIVKTDVAVAKNYLTGERVSIQFVRPCLTRSRFPIPQKSCIL
jgi:hypothetical protein